MDMFHSIFDSIAIVVVPPILLKLTICGVILIYGTSFPPNCDSNINFLNPLIIIFRSFYISNDTPKVPSI